MHTAIAERGTKSVGPKDLTENYLHSAAGEKVTPSNLRNCGTDAEQNKTAKIAETRMDIGSPSRARTYDLRINRLSQSFGFSDTYIEIRSAITAN